MRTSHSSSPIRRLALSLLATTVLVASVACGTTEETTGSDQPLQLWVRQTGNALKAYEAIAADFTTATGIKVEIFGTVTDFEQKLNAAASAKDLPDVMVQDTSALGSLVTRGLVREVDRTKVAGGSDLSDRAWSAAVGFDGKHYGIPFSAQAFVLLVRSDWRKKLNQPAPKTWDDLAALSAAMTTGDPDGNGKADTAGLLVPGSTQRGYASWYFTSYLWQSGGDYFVPQGEGKFRPTFDQPEAVRALAWLQDRFCKDKSVQPAALNDVTQQTNEAYASGAAGIYLTGPYNFGKFDKSPGKEAFEVLAPPTGPKGSTVMAEGENIYLMAGKGDASAAKRLAEYLITEQAQVSGMTKYSDGVVVRLPVNTRVDVTAVTRDPRWTVTRQVYETSGRYVPSVPNWTPFRQIAADGINTALARCSDPAAAARTTNEAIRAELQKQNILAEG